MLINKYVVLGCLLLGSICSQAQLASPKILLNYSYTPPSDFSDTTGQYAVNTMSIGFSVPVFGKLTHIEDHSLSFLLVLLNGEFEIEHTEIGAFDGHRYFFKPWIGASMIYHTVDKGTLIGNFQIRWMEDEYTASEIRLFPSGMLLWHFPKNERISYLVGVTYTYNFGAGTPFPVLGLNKKLGNNAKLGLILPFSVDYQKLTSKGYTYHIFLKPNGDVARFGNNNVFSQTDKDLLMRQRSFKLGMNYAFSWYMLQFTPEIGMLFHRSITFSDPESSFFDRNEIYKTAVGPSLFIKIKIRVSLGGSGKGVKLIDRMNSDWMGF